MINIINMTDASYTTCNVSSYDMFRTNGIAPTPQRQAIWDVLAGSNRGLSISELIEIVRSKGIGQATVYRTVMIFLETGIAVSVRTVSGKNIIVALRGGHSHPVVCTECHAIVEFETCHLELLEELLVLRTGYRITGHHLVIFGRCPECLEALE